MKRSHLIVMAVVALAVGLAVLVVTRQSVEARTGTVGGETRERAQVETLNPVKTYAGRPSIALPAPSHRGIPVEEAIQRRRSVRRYGRRPLTLKEISELLNAAQGVTATVGGFDFRAAPSAGATYPMEVYLFVFRAETIPPGLYHYDLRRHALTELERGDLRESLMAATLGQSAIAASAAVVVLSAVPARTAARYGERAERYIFIEAGHIFQNLALQAVSLGLGTVQIGAFRDEALNRLIGLDGQTESAIYLTALGPP